MREYFRQQEIMFRYHRARCWSLRLIGLAAVVISGEFQWSVMTAYTFMAVPLVMMPDWSDIRYMLPLTDEEHKRQQLLRVWFLMLRLGAAGIIGKLLQGIWAWNGVIGSPQISTLLRYPVHAVVYFVLQMLWIADMAVGMVADKPAKKDRGHGFLSAVGSIVFLGSSIFSMSRYVTALPEYLDSKIHIPVMFAACVVLFIDMRRTIRHWRVLGNTD